MTVRPELAHWYEQVHDALGLFSQALERDRAWIVAAGRVALVTLGRAAPGPEGEEQAVARVTAAIAELVVAARDGDEESLRFALRWVTESISALGA